MMTMQNAVRKVLFLWYQMLLYVCNNAAEVW